MLNICPMNRLSISICTYVVKKHSQKFLVGKFDAFLKGLI